MGRTDGFRYIGIQPIPELDDTITFEDVRVSETDRTVRPGETSGQYLEGSLTGPTPFDDETTRGVADQIASTLRSDGHDVSIDPTIRQIGYGRNLF